MIDVRSDITKPLFNKGDVVCFKDHPDHPYLVTSKEWVGTTQMGVWFYHFDISTGYGYEYNLELYSKANIVNDWISVKDKLPDVNVKVLFTDGVEPYIGYMYILHRNNVWHIDSADEDIINVTHWMKIPKLPE